MLFFPENKTKTCPWINLLFKYRGVVFFLVSLVFSLWCSVLRKKDDRKHGPHPPTQRLPKYLLEPVSSLLQ